ncbi:MAG: aldehyde dehydrogenase family protein [Cytophagaceae bacterium]|nr:aldehyde dehydrogenase family protein [Cytophagaceae bacterium]MDW8455338.1 aldehyde dehydrogenase family protein [Cytophagaceae bacterium]
MKIENLLKSLKINSINGSYSTGKEWGTCSGTDKVIHTPIDGSKIATVRYADKQAYEHVVITACSAFEYWKTVPAPRRGEVIRQIGNTLRTYKRELGMLITYESGKILEEALGEVQEMIDICDFAVGLSRQLHGFTMHSERPLHRMYEQYHPLGIVGIITAFNFPAAVWSWNAMIAAVCGDVCLWKPSEKTPLTAIACQNIIAEVLEKNQLPEGIFNLIIGDSSAGHWIACDKRIPLVSATGSTAMGRNVAQTVGARLGKTILELGGNNAIILTENADIELALPAITFGAVGTCGQRCTSTRRLIVHDSIYDKVLERLKIIYESLPVGNPLDPSTLVGPLIDENAVKNFLSAIETAKRQGASLVTGGKQLSGDQYPGDLYVQPSILEATPDMPIVKEETFAPILYVIKYHGNVHNAIQIQNDVPQGLSSAIFSDNLQETEIFLSSQGSDCGIANVNIGTSGAEIGGAFGGEKDTGGGRESGSDAWKAYMRRQTNTINFGKELTLAQGIKFTVS